VKRVRVFNLSNCLSSFVKDIYTGDSIADWKVNKKIECLQNFPDRKVTVFDMEIPNPVFKYVEVKKRETCSQIEDLKRYIRGTYSQKIQPYFFDTIIHISDDQHENLLMQQVLHRYASCLESDTASPGPTGPKEKPVVPVSIIDILNQNGGRK